MNATTKAIHAAALTASNPDPKWLAYRAEHTGSASATWKPSSKFTLNLNGRYVSKYKAVSSSMPQSSMATTILADFIVLNTGLQIPG